MKKVYVSETESPRRRGRPVVRWKDRVKEYMHDKVVDRGIGIELARRKCMDRETLLPWPCPSSTFLVGTRHHTIDTYCQSTIENIYSFQG